MTNNEFNQLSSDVKEIKDALLGSGTHQKNGLIERICKTENRISKIERLIWICSGGAIVISAIVKSVI